ncbi:hypothetical protein DIQ79_27995 [Mycolicibacterium smegmatis]|nr:hypothetical protein EYS45_27420 [Mycolicibacterium smegmatis MC2 155]TBM41645.1 hypothetical protein DIQ86_23025 [Mycolicibacterium smegmatis]TBM46283.1 hypothetical protein DIQ85_28790 [Mycolicibacterium smegmatis]TBM56012.1 hypothetical protein DIQ83_28310 [Mycolicibacterium smegmatis]TBM64455.1 hypothetical protein DIQ82_28780 [Mycolicibacterium smegmatis]
MTRSRHSAWRRRHVTWTGWSRPWLPTLNWCRRYPAEWCSEDETTCVCCWRRYTEACVS